jgi:hypothetical protein
MAPLSLGYLVFGTTFLVLTGANLIFHTSKTIIYNCNYFDVVF